MCLGHQCKERRYRANITNCQVKNKHGESCPADKAICDAARKTLDDAATAAAEEQHCEDDDCKCTLPDWPTEWVTAEKNLTKNTDFLDITCTAEVTFTYDWQYQDRSSDCYKKPPK